MVWISVRMLHDLGDFNQIGFGTSVRLKFSSEFSENDWEVGPTLSQWRVWLSED